MDYANAWGGVGLVLFAMSVGFGLMLAWFRQGLGGLSQRDA